MFFFIKLARHVNHDERMNSIDFGGHRSKMKVRIGIIDKCGMRGDAALCLVIFIIGSILTFWCCVLDLVISTYFLSNILMGQSV